VVSSCPSGSRSV